MYIKRLDQVLGNLTSSEERIATYISEHLDEVRKLTSTELAEKTNTAQATVIRFSQKVGYSSYKKMINDIDASQGDDHVDENIDYNESVEKTKIRLKNEFDVAFDVVFSQNKNSIFETAADYIYKAKNVLLFGFTSRKGDLAHYFSGILLKIGINSYTDEYSSALYAKLELCQENDVIIFISESGETREILNMAKMARKKKMKVISITRPKKSSLSKLSDINIKLLEYGNRTYLRSLTIMHASLLIIDIIYLELVKKDSHKAEILSTKNSIVTKLNYIEPLEEEITK